MQTPEFLQEEILLRQIKSGGDPLFYDPKRNPPIERILFLPSSQDFDGLSLIRSRFRSNVWAAHRLEMVDAKFRLARMSVKLLESIAISVGFNSFPFVVTADSLDNIRGEPYAHCVAQQINIKAYKSDRNSKMRIKEWAILIAKSLTLSDISGPYPPPTEDDPYRPAEFQDSK